MSTFFLTTCIGMSNTDSAMKISDILKKWRVMSDKTQAEAAQEIGVSRTAYARLESGQEPSADTLVTIFFYMVGRK